MSLFKLKKVPKSEFDPINEAKQALKYFGIDSLASEAYVFGSAVEGDFSAESDIDILVVFPSNKELTIAQNHLTKKSFSNWVFDWVFKLQSDFEQRSQIGGVCYLAKNSGVKIL